VGASVGESKMFQDNMKLLVDYYNGKAGVAKRGFLRVSLSTF